MANTIKIKRKTTTGAPLLSSLSDGEFCLVVPDDVIYLRKDASTLIKINTTNITVSTTAPASPITGDLWVDTN